MVHQAANFVVETEKETCVNRDCPIFGVTAVGTV